MERIKNSITHDDLEFFNLGIRDSEKETERLISLYGIEKTLAISAESMCIPLSGSIFAPKNLETGRLTATYNFLVRHPRIFLIRCMGEIMAIRSPEDIPLPNMFVVLLSSEKNGTEHVLQKIGYEDFIV